MKRYLYILLSTFFLLPLGSCDDYLDKTPLSDVTPASFFRSEADLAAYTINYYSFDNVIGNGNYGVSFLANDNGTDNQAGVDYSTFWVPGEWKVGTGNWDFTQIRNMNYFLDQVLPLYEAGEITGNQTNVRHYIGEGFFMRAYAYFKQLRAYGDFPIVSTALVDEESVLVEASERQPRNKVARFIIEDLKKACEMLSDAASCPGGKNRINKDCAYLLLSRVALYEGTWEKCHKGTAFVPGGTGWPGKDAQGINIDTEVAYFLGEAMAAAKVVGDKIVGSLAENTDAPEGFDVSLKCLNPYYGMFADENMESYAEVLMWKSFNQPLGITHNIQMQMERNGGGTGWTRGLVNSFLMRNGLPIYDAASGYSADWEKEGITATLQGRDSRIQIFTKRDNDIDFYNAAGTPVLATEDWTVKGGSETRMVTGFAVKKGKHYDEQQQTLHSHGTSGSIVFLGTEALLNYMEACYEKTGNIDGTADGYWKALRERAKVDVNYSKTIAATQMAEEAKGDFGAYTHGQLIDATRYNIRRERRNELIGMGMRMDDLKRWRALDQVKNYQIEGMRYWGSSYEGTWKDDKGVDLVIVSVADGSGNMSDEATSGVYIRPYQISSLNNSVFNGYNFTPAHYLNPLGMATFRQTASDKEHFETSNVYQNPGWPIQAEQGPSQVE